MSNKYSAISLFTGAGGMDIGFEKAGIKTVFANELMKEAAETYNANHSNDVMVNDDINNVIVKMSITVDTKASRKADPCTQSVKRPHAWRRKSVGV